MNGFILDPLVSTGRGSYVFHSKTTLEKILALYDKAPAEFRDESREAVILDWNAAERWANASNQPTRSVA